MATQRSQFTSLLKSVPALRAAGKAAPRALSRRNNNDFLGKIAPAPGSKYPPAALAAVAFLALFALLLLASSNSPTPAYAQDSSSVVTVPADWTLKPSGLGVGDQFRLLIVTSTTRNANSTDISDYDTHVQTAVAAGHAGIQSHSSQFKVLGSTASVAARDHTETTYTSADKGVPIYWLGGAKAADEYEDFYDGSWDSYVFRAQTGQETSPHRVWTGTNNDGTAATNFLGSTSGVGAGTKASGKHFVNSVLSSGTTYPFYGLSAVFQVAGAATPPTLSGLTVSAGTLTPAFAGGTLDYTVPDLPNAASRITVTATADADVTVAYEDGSGTALTDADADTAGFQADLEVGENTIKVKVTKGGASQTYTLKLTRAEPPCDAIWCATLTVGTLVFAGTPEYGWSSQGGYGSITDRDFSYDGDRYEFTTTIVRRQSLEVHFSGDASGDIATEATRAKLNLHVGEGANERVFNLGSGGYEVEDGLFPSVEWPNPGLSWSVNDKVSLKLKEVPILTGLTVSPGTLTPAFGNATLEYAVPNVPNASSRITVTATPETGATVAYEDGSGNALSDADSNTAGDQFDLEVGENTIQVKLTEGDASKTYTLKITRAAPAASSDASLSALSLGVTLSPGFASATISYSASVPNSWSVITVVATPNHAAATVDTTPTDAFPSAAGDQVNLDVGSNTISVKVTAEDGATTRTYTVTVTRAAPAASSDASLSALSLSSGTLSPGFAGATLSYAASVVNSVSWTTVTATPNHAAASVLITPTDADATTAGDQVNLDVGSNTISVKVTAEDGTTTRTYTVTVTRAAPTVSSDASLSGLALSGVTLTPAFAADTTRYTASVYNSVTSTTVTATPNHAAAKVVITPVDAEGHKVNLDVGSNTVSVKVTAEDGTTTQTYTATVTRAANSVTFVVTAPNGVETGRRNLEITWVDTQDCADGYKAYTGFVSAGVVLGFVEVLDETASTADDITNSYTRFVSIGQMQVWCGERSSGRMVGEVAVLFDAANEDRVIPGTYTTAAADSAAPPPTLSALTVSAGTLTPAFASGTLEYAVPDVPNATGRITVTATPETGATVAYEDGSGNALTDVDSTTDGDQFDLEVGENTIKVKVTKGDASQTYTLTVTRAAPAASSDASLSGLALSGVTLSPDFAAATTLYTASVYNSVESTTVTATPTDNDATVDITPVDADLSAEGRQVSLDVGSNVVSVKVTAEDGTTTRTYTVTVTRAANSATVVVTAPDGATDGTRAFEVTWVDTQDCTDGYKAYLGLVSNGVVVGATEIVDDATGTADVITATYDRLVNVGVVQVWCGERGSGRMVGEVAVPIAASANNRVIPGRYSSAAGEPPTLSGLTVSAGTLTPAFAGGTLAYAVPGLAYGNNRITVTAMADADATVSYEDGSGNALSDVDATTAGDQFDLVVGENTIKVRVTEGGLSQTYTLTVTRAKPQVSISAAAATADEGDSLTFTVTRTPAAGDPLTLTVNVAETGDLVPAASEGDKTVTIAANATGATLVVATGADDSDWEEHSTVSVTASPNTGYTLGSGAATASTLVEDDDFPAAEAALVVSPTTVDEPGMATVSVTVTTRRNEMPHGPGGTLTVASSDVTASAGSDYNAFNQSYTLDAAGFSAVTTPGGQRWLRDYSGTVTVRDDTTQESAETFNVALTKANAPKVTLLQSTVPVTIPANDAPAASSDASLSGLALSGITLSPTFASATTTGYTASVANGVSSTTVTATPNHAGAEAVTTPPDADVNTEGHQVNLDVGDNVVSVKVTAEDTTTTRTYTVTVTRAAAVVANSVTAVITAPNPLDADRRRVAVSWTDGQDCSGTYTAHLNIEAANLVAKMVDDTTGSDDPANVITATYATTLLSKIEVWCGERNTGRKVAEVAIPTDSVNGWPIPGTYATAAAEPPALSGLTVSAGTLTPDFAGDTLEYTVPGLHYGHSRITITATAGADATVSYEDGAGAALVDASSTAAGFQADLAVGQNTIKVKVTEGAASQTYTLALTRADKTVLSSFRSDWIAGTQSLEFNWTDSGLCESPDKYRIYFYSGSANIAYSDGAVAATERTTTIGPFERVLANRAEVWCGTRSSGRKAGEITHTHSLAAASLTWTEEPHLTGLTVSDGALTPTFVSATLKYAASVDGATGRITVAATPSSGATVSWRDRAGNDLADADADTAGQQVNLAEGENVIGVRVTKGDASHTYTLTVARASDSAAPQPTIELDPEITGFGLVIRFGEGVTGFDESDLTLSQGWSLVAGSLEADAAEAGTYRVGFRPERELAGLTADLTVILPAGAARDLAASPNASLEATLREADLYAGPAVMVYLAPFEEDRTYDPGSLAGEFRVGFLFIRDHFEGAPVTGFEATDIALTNATVRAFIAKPPRGLYGADPVGPGSDQYAGSYLYEATIVPDAVCASAGCTITVRVPHGAALGAISTAESELTHLVRPNVAAEPLTVQREGAGTGARVSALAVRQAVNSDDYWVDVLISGSSQNFYKHISVETGETDPLTGWEGGLHSFWVQPPAAGPVTLSIDLNRDGDYDDSGVDFTYVIRAATAQAQSRTQAQEDATAEAKAAPEPATIPATIPDAALRGILERVLGKEAGAAITTEELAALRLLDLRGSGVAGLAGLEHALRLTDLYLDDPSLDLSPLEGLGVVIHLSAPPAPDGGEVPAPALSTDAALSGLTLSGVDLGAFDPATTGYAAGVGHDVTETTVTATVNDGGASYTVKLDGAADSDGVIPLAEGSNVITVEVTAEDGETARTYTVTVTRAAAPDPGPQAAIDLSAAAVVAGTEITVTMSFGGLESDADTATRDYVFRADVVDAENGEADACEDRANGYGLGVDRYMWQVDEDPETRTGTISAGCPAGDYTLRASVSSADNVELASASASFTVREPETPLSSDAALSGLALSGVDIGTFDPAATNYAADVGHGVAETTVTATVNDDGASYTVKLDGVADADWVIPLAVGSNVITIEVTAEDGETTQIYTVTVTRAAPPLSTDAALSGLALSGVDIGDFDPATGGYAADVDHDVTETTVTATVNDDGASYTVKLDGVADSDGVIPLAVGSNVIAVEVTAEDGETIRTYTVTVTRAAPPLSKDATLSGLTLSGVDIGSFVPATAGYAASVANDVTETTVTATVNDGGASYTVKLDGVADSDGVIPLAVGSNVITVEVTAEDGETARTYTVTVTRDAPPLSNDATLSGLALSDAPFTFASDTTSYEVNVAHDVDQTIVTATANDDGAAYAIRLDGVADADGVIPLAVGSNVITVEVTAEDGNTVKTYKVTISRAAPAAPPDAPDQPTGEVLEPGKVTLDWEDVDGATGYQVGLWSQPNLVPLPSDDMPGVTVQMNGSSARLSGLPAEWSHYWLKIRASNDGGTSGWSDWLTLENQ